MTLQTLWWLPIVTGLVGIILGFYLNRRAARFDRLLKAVEESQNRIVVPMVADLRRIEHLQDSNEVLLALDQFFNKYTDGSAQVHWLSSARTIEMFFETESSFRQFRTSNTDEDWQVFWQRFKQLGETVRSLYWLNHETMFRDHGWLRYQWNASLLGQTLTEASRWVSFVLNLALLVEITLLVSAAYTNIKAPSSASHELTEFLWQVFGYTLVLSIALHLTRTVEVSVVDEYPRRSRLELWIRETSFGKWLRGRLVRIPDIPEKPRSNRKTPNGQR